MYPARSQEPPGQAGLIHQAQARLALLDHSIASLNSAPDETFKYGLSLQIRDIAQILDSLKQGLAEGEEDGAPPDTPRKESVTPLLNERERSFIDVYRQLNDSERNNIGKLMLQLQKKPRDVHPLANRSA